MINIVIFIIQFLVYQFYDECVYNVCCVVDSNRCTNLANILFFLLQFSLNRTPGNCCLFAFTKNK